MALLIILRNCNKLRKMKVAYEITYEGQSLFFERCVWGGLIFAVAFKSFDVWPLPPVYRLENIDVLNVFCMLDNKTFIFTKKLMKIYTTMLHNQVKLIVLCNHLTVTTSPQNMISVSQYMSMLYSVTDGITEVTEYYI